MDRPEWIEAALGRGRGALARVGNLFGGGDSADKGDGGESKPKAEEPKEKEPKAKEPKAKAEAAVSKQPKPAEEPAAERAAPGPVARVRERPALAIASATMALLVIVWIAWAIHVGSSNGGSAAVGVLISWPLFFLIVANLVLIGIGLTMLFRHLQPANGAATTPAPAVQEKQADGEEAKAKDEPEAEDDDSDEPKDEDEDDDSDEDDQGDDDAGEKKAAG